MTQEQIEVRTKEIWDSVALPLIMEFFVLVFGIVEEKLWLIALSVVCALFIIGITQYRVDKLKDSQE
jgi:hypothetical protein